MLHVPDMVTRFRQSSSEKEKWRGSPKEKGQKKAALQESRPEK